MSVAIGPLARSTRGGIPPEGGRGRERKRSFESCGDRVLCFLQIFKEPIERFGFCSTRYRSATFDFVLGGSGH